MGVGSVTKPSEGLPEGRQGKTPLMEEREGSKAIAMAKAKAMVVVLGLVKAQQQREELLKAEL